MNSDSGMTPEKWTREAARKLLLSDHHGPTEFYAKGFLQGVAYQEEKAKGLVEALECALVCNQTKKAMKTDLCPNCVMKFKDELARYHQGQEKNDGR